MIDDKMTLTLVNTIGTIVLTVLVVILLLLLVRKRLFLKNKDGIAGTEIYTLRLPQIVILKKCGKYLVIAGIFIYSSMKTFLGIYHVIGLSTILLIKCLTEMLPQKIYENGVLDCKGFIPWNMFSEIQLDDENEEILKLILKKSWNGLGEKEIKVYCIPEQKKEVLNYIKECLNRGSSEVETGKVIL